MKKTIAAAALSSMLVLGLASSALALHDTATAETPTVVKGTSKITLDGTVRQRGYYDRDNWNESVDGAGAHSPGRSGYDTRVQLGVQAKVSDQATGYVKLESGAGTSDVDAWGNPTVGGAGAADDNDYLFTGGSKQGGLTILEAWVNYQPGVWGVKAGHMPLALGNKLFFDHTGSGDDALVFYANLGEATHVAGLTIKFDENANGAFPGVADASDDLDGYVGLITHKLSDSLNLGGNWTYLRGGSDSATAAEPFSGLAMSNIGLTADGKVGAIDYMADLEFQFGDVADVDNVMNVDAGGWAMKVGANYDLGVGKVGLVFGYGSGDDAEDVADDAADFLAGDKDLNHDGFINFLTDTTYDTIIAGYRSPIPGAASWAGASNTTGRNTGLSNLTLLQLKGSTKTVCPLTGKDLSLLATASYMKLSEDTYNYGTNKADDVGTELDMVATWALTAGLNYRVEAAYLFVGDVYESAANGAGSNPDDLMFLRHSLDLKF